MTLAVVTEFLNELKNINVSNTTVHIEGVISNIFEGSDENPEPHHRTYYQYKIFTAVNEHSLLSKENYKSLQNYIYLDARLASIKNISSAYVPSSKEDNTFSSLIRRGLKRDVAYSENNLLKAILEDNEVTSNWKKFTQKCTSCDRYITKGYEETKELVCSICSEVSLQESFKILLANLVKEDQKDVIDCFKKFSIEEKLLLEFTTSNYWAKPFVKKVKPADIPRFTVNLTQYTKNKELPSWYTKTPDTFKSFVRAADGENYETLCLGSLDQAKFKQVRIDTYNKMDPKPDKNPIPNTPKFKRLMEFFGCSLEIVQEFESRLDKKGISSIGKIKDIIKDSAQQNVYISNEHEPLFMIGNWGNGSYHSCQRWKQPSTNTPDGGHCKVLASLEDPNILVIWLGSFGDMKSRMLVRKVKFRDSEDKYLYLDSYYGSTFNKQTIVQALLAWAKDNGYAGILSSEINLLANGKLADSTFIGLEKVFYNYEPAYFDRGMSPIKDHSNSNCYSLVSNNYATYRYNV